MPRFAANLSMLFNEVPFLDRFAVARSAGFVAVECQFPYAYPKDELAAALKSSGLQMVSHNLPAGDWNAGDRGMACDPARVAEFRASVETALEYAVALKCPRVNCLAGTLPVGVSSEHAKTTLINNLKFAAPLAKSAGITLLIEPINTFDMPGFFLNRTAQALSILDAVGADNLRIQYDIYHAQRTEGELGNTLKTHLAQIGHIQIADNPGRHEPGTGEINYPWLFQHLDAIGYTGWVGCEYRPKASTLNGLGWLRTMQSKAFKGVRLQRL